MPRWGDITVQCDFRNNVIYDWGHTCGYGDVRTLNYVNNYVRKGPSTTQKPPFFIIDPKVVLPASLYLDDNIMAGMAGVCRDNWKGVLAERWLQSPAPFAWKKAHGLSLSGPNVANAVNAEGYTALGVY